jgi:DNA-nicking Smr family endonuclease
MTKKPARGAHQDLVPDIELWDKVIKAVEPLRTRSPNPPAPPHKSDAAKLRFRSASFLPVRPLKSGPPEPPPLTGLDRRTTQKLMRGQVQYEAKLDLHGLGIGEARIRLASFLALARSHGNRLVLVVTGKGASPFSRHTLHGDSHYHAPERQGRLRRLVSDWLHEPEFRQHVSGFQPAHPKHGGGGAYYIRLRRSGVGKQ